MAVLGSCCNTCLTPRRAPFWAHFLFSQVTLLQCAAARSGASVAAFKCLLTVPYAARASTPLSPCFLGSVWRALLIVNAMSFPFDGWPYVV